MLSDEELRFVKRVRRLRKDGYRPSECDRSVASAHDGACVASLTLQCSLSRSRRLLRADAAGRERGVVERGCARLGSVSLMMNGVRIRRRRVGDRDVSWRTRSVEGECPRDDRAPSRSPLREAGVRAERAVEDVDWKFRQ